MLENSKFTKIDEEFVCENCGKKVPKLGYTCRNHCPYCLHSKHLDINPGDRAEDCHGILEPIGLETNSKKGYVIIFKCKKCIFTFSFFTFYFWWCRVLIDVCKHAKSLQSCPTHGDPRGL